MTRLMALNAPGAQIVTIRPPGPTSFTMRSARITQSSRSGRITQLNGDSMTFDYARGRAAAICLG